MRVKRVNRYYCDFCKKSGGSSYHMQRHESACIQNPNRSCGLCGTAGYSELRIQDFPSDVWPTKSNIIVDPTNGEWVDVDSQECLSRIIARAVELQDDPPCPACVLAMIRQSGTPVFMGFDYNAAHQHFWEIQNQLVDRVY